ncbi:30S ribosomal protein S16 [Muriicola sp.]|uniref:30S ribosomal protein S16 n=1 Tax=Muriicola sp. TaxID=2020856 RepID=UPI003C776242
MPVRIRLQRHGKKGKPFYWIVAADGRAKRDGKFLEKLGIYDPNTNPATIEVKIEESVQWLNNGAQPSETAKRILSYKGVLLKHHLLGGVRKGALTEEEAEAKFQAWVAEKEKSVSKKEENLSKAQQEARKKALEAEKEVNAKRAQAAAEAEVAESPEAVTAEEEVVAVETAPAAEEAVTQAEEAVEAPAAEEAAPEAAAKEAPAAEEVAATEAVAEEAPAKEEAATEDAKPAADKE